VTPAARRIAVVGVTGSGKTTFAAALAAALDLTHVEFDALHWEPEWVPADLTLFRNCVTQRVLDAVAGRASASARRGVSGERRQVDA